MNSFYMPFYITKLLTFKISQKAINQGWPLGESTRAGLLNSTILYKKY